MLEQVLIKNFDEIYNIMEQSFPLTEFRPKNEQKALFENKLYKILGVRKNDQFVAFAAIWDFDDIVFIEHLATDVKLRNGGLGSHILQSIISSCNKMVCLEVEPPVDDLTNRRVKFYERNGLYLNNYPYIQPSITKGQDDIVLKKLFFCVY